MHSYLANRLGDTLYSHQGLTYGGLITKKQATTAEICEVFIKINEYLYHSGVQRLSINLHHGYTIIILPRKISMR